MKDIEVKINKDNDPSVDIQDQLNATEYNSATTETKNAVTTSGQTLDDADDNQLARSMAILATTAQSWQDTGAVNVINLQPLNSALVFPGTTSAYTLLNGLKLQFIAGNTNSGACTINIEPSSGVFLGAKPLYKDVDGADFVGGELVAGKLYEATYIQSFNSNNGAFVIPGADLPALTGVEIGSLIIWPAISATFPAGYLLCSGQAVSRTTYATLFSVLGTSWGAGDGSTTFNLPNQVDAYIRGSDDAGVVGTLVDGTGGVANGVTNYGVAVTVDGHVLSESEMPPHFHGVLLSAIPGGESGQLLSNQGSLIAGATNTDSRGGNEAHKHGASGLLTLNYTPYSFKVNWLIKAL